MLPAAPVPVSHPCVCVCVCCPCTRWSSISWPGSVVCSLWEGWAPEWGWRPNKTYNLVDFVKLSKLGAILTKYVPGRTFHLSGCWPTQPQVYSCPEPGERWCTGYTLSLPSSQLRLCGISLLVFFLWFPGSGRGKKEQYNFVKGHLTIFFSAPFPTCVMISWAKIFLPSVIIMLVNLLKRFMVNISCADLTKRCTCRDLGCYFVLPEDGITEDGARESNWCGLNGSEWFELQLLLVLST